MSLQLLSPEQEVARIVEFFRSTFHHQHKKQAVIAVSGGLDSSLALALLVQAFPREQLTVLHLPYEHQSTEDSRLACGFLGIPDEQQRLINIAPIVDKAAILTFLTEKDTVRLGNFMARARMMIVYDTAKEKEALVCGTENKSEHYLGYFTRFGDAASDIEPIAHLYKTQVKQLAEYLCFPDQLLKKVPSAGLWSGQTDESELGFTYNIADQVLEQFVDEHIKPEDIKIDGIKGATIRAVIDQVRKNRFKFNVPYVIK